VVRRYSIIKEKRKQGFSLSQISLMLTNEHNNVINMPGPQENTAEMSDQKLLHGFLTELYQKASPETKVYVDELCRKWNVRLRAQYE
jgi:DNA-binding transcriptional MerR regulator